MVKGTPVFTTDWFSMHIPVWLELLAEFKDRPVKFLEVGSYEGRSCIWLCENVLTHPDARIVCVDTFKGNDEMAPQDKVGIFERFMNNVGPFGSKIEKVMAMESGTALRSFPSIETFDFIYIDGCHRSRNVLEDAVLSFPLLKTGGIMLFDDYGGLPGVNCTAVGVDSFLRCYAERDSDNVKVIMKAYQLAIRKV